MKNVLYLREDGTIHATSTLPDSVEPPETPGLTWVVVDALPEDPAAWRCIDGILTEVGAPPESAEKRWRKVRRERGLLLTATDWTDTASAPARLGPSAYAAWQTYRQELRDITDQPDPFAIEWPTPPGG